jgi:acyl-CoA synthetase (AMP-forming)/AMP-acid ligase II
MSKIKTIAAAVDAIAMKSPSRLALTSPFQSSEKLTYQDLSLKSNALAGWLHRYGLEKNDILVSDLPNVTENVLLQLACNRLGAGYGTAKNIESMAKQFPKVKGAVSTTTSGFLADVGLPLPYLSADYLQDLILSLDNPVGTMEDVDELFDVGEEITPHGYYNSSAAYTNQQALAHGMESIEELKITEDDTICISITLCHAFGMGSAVCAALQSGACIALPAVGGIEGCGVPSERAAATLDVLESEQCTILFADTHTIKALPEPSSTLTLRDGVVKIGSGSTFLEETREYGGVSLKTIGKKE